MTDKTSETIAKIRAHLETLRLTKISEVLEEMLTEALAENMPAPRLLERLLAAEAAQRIERRVERRIRQARLPERKLLVDFDFTFQTGVDRRQILAIAEMDFVARGQSVIFGGHSGTGKSHLAQALLLIGCTKNLRCLYTTAADMLRTLKSGLLDDTLEAKLKRYLAPDLLLIDEVGFDRIEQEDARPAALFFKVVDGRYAKKSTMMTTNLDFQELGAYLGDPVVTTAIVDRLVHHAVIINIEGPSWRMHQSELLNKESAGEEDA